ncbi:hypothetical protein JQ632_33125 [Bradyrhizobium liaoningense]|nr:hypothetical protein [Bradyrhizobium liaoningense]
MTLLTLAPPHHRNSPSMAASPPRNHGSLGSSRQFCNKIKGQSGQGMPSLADRLAVASAGKPLAEHGEPVRSAQAENEPRCFPNLAIGANQLGHNDLQL